MINPPSSLIRALWIGAVLLVVIGVGTAIGRAAFMADFVTRVDPVRQRVMATLNRQDPFLLERPEALAEFDGRYAAHPLPTLLHIVPGAVFLLFAPFQFSARLRSRHIQLHRWSGRILVILGSVGAVAGLYFGLLMPYGGGGEAAVIAVFGGLFLAAIIRAFVAIRRHQVARHREWMIRAFAIAIGISTVRVVAAILDVALTPAGVPPRALFVLSLWAGWVITLGAAELWIKYTRPQVHALAVPER